MRIQEAIGAIFPLKPATVTSLIIIFYNSENSIRDTRPFFVHCFVTAVLWSIRHPSYISEAVARFGCQITEIAPRNLTAWIRTGLTLPISWLWFTLLAVQTDNPSWKLPTQTHQLHCPASSTSFSDTTTSCRKTAVVLKQSNVLFAEFFISIAKIWCS